MICYNSCSQIFNELGFELVNTHFYSSGYGEKTFRKEKVVITFYQDNKSKESEFIIAEHDRGVVYIGKLSSQEFLEELLNNIDYEYNV